MPSASTQQIIQYSQRHTPHVKLIALTMHHHPHQARYLTDNGLAGYVFKGSRLTIESTPSTLYVQENALSHQLLKIK